MLQPHEHNIRAVVTRAIKRPNNPSLARMEMALLHIEAAIRLLEAAGDDPSVLVDEAAYLEIRISEEEKAKG